MKGLRLALALLRASRSPGIALSHCTVEALQDSINGVRISRRGFLELGGAALGGSVALWKGKPSRISPFEIVGDSKRLAFLLDGREQWVIDTDLFSGSPDLCVHRGKDRIQLALRGARFPGTELPADFTSDIRSALSGWEMDLRLQLGGFHGEAPFERWLLGEVPVRGRVGPCDGLHGLPQGLALFLSSASHAAFFPKWVLRFEGRNVASLSGFGFENLCSDSAAVTLLTPHDASIFRVPEKRRTLFTLDRGDYGWRDEPVLRSPEGTRFEASSSVFDRAALEVGELQRGLLAESLEDSPRLSFLPGEHLLASDGRSFRLPLCKARFAATWDAQGEQNAFVAEHPEDPVWLHADGCALQLGNCGGEAPFELVCLNGEVKRLKCAPALIRSALPMPGAIVEPVRAPAGSRVALISSLVHARPEPAMSYVSLDAQSRGGVLSLAEQVHSVLRPQDLLSLSFQFFNLTLKPGSPNGQLVRTNPRTPAYISVGFAPQNIAEQAFFEAAQEFGSVGGSEPGPPPVQARIAGGSRLVFSLPNGVNEIPYTLNALLDWSKFEPSVSVLAQPAPLTWVLPRIVLSKVAKTAAARQLAAARAPLVPQFSAPPSVPLNSAEFAANHPTILEHISKLHPELLTATPGLAQGLIRVNRDAAAPTAQTLQTATQLAQAAFRANPNLGALIAQLMTIQQPEPTTTAIEAPYRLYISPSPYGAWAHSILPVAAANGWTELWHTRLAVKGNKQVDEDAEGQRIVRAIWSPDYGDPGGQKFPPPCGTPQGPTPPRFSLDARDRYEIVRLTSDFLTTVGSSKPYTPLPVQVNRLMLTSLGAWLDSRGAWPLTPQGLSIQEWVHRATMGRDNYVRVVYKGYLFPFGHAASLVKITERKFQRTPPNGGNMVAYLRQRMYIVVRQHQRSFPALGAPNQGRDFPFRSMEITTQTTPNLDPPAQTQIGSLGQNAFWPHVGGASGQYFAFHCVAVDLDNQETEFTVPLLFVSTCNDLAFDQSQSGVQQVINAYNASQVINAYNPLGGPSTDPRVATTDGKKIAYAPSSKPGDTSLDTSVISLAALPLLPNQDRNLLKEQEQPGFCPRIAQASVRIPAIAQLIGSDSTTLISLDPTYIASGMPSPSGPVVGHPNAGQVFAVLDPSRPVRLDFAGNGAGDKAGGVVNPSMTIVGLSRALGPVGGKPASISAKALLTTLPAAGMGLVPAPPPPDPLQAIKSGTFDPQDIFATLENAKILGGVSLADVVQKVVNRDLSAEGGALKIKTRTTFPTFPNGQENVLAAPLAIETTVDWTPSLQDVPTAKPVFIASKYKDPNTKATMEIVAILHTDLSGSPKPTYSITGKIANFQIDFFPEIEEVIKVGFDEFDFKSATGTKLDVTPNISGVEFLGPLSFVNQLESILNQNKDKLNDPPSLDVTPTHVRVGYSLDVPDVGIGVMSLQNLSLGATLFLPFTDQEGPAAVSFAFCSKDRPFIMSYCGFAGGGYFAIAVSLAGVQSIDISLEFGGSLSVNLGVASGGVSIMAGLNFTLGQITVDSKTGQGCVLIAYIRLNGYLSILGLISLSLEFYLSLTYEQVSGQGSVLYGQATLTVEVDVLMFSKSVDITVEKTITSSGGLSASLVPVVLPVIGLGGPPMPFAHPGPPSLTDLMSASDWRTYMLAYAAA